MKGTVLKSTGNLYQVLTEDGEHVECTLRGKIRLKGIRSTNPVAVGDKVIIEIEDSEGVISEIIPRENHIIRRSTNLSKESHIIAANIDQLVLMATLKQPATSTGFIDRVLITAEAYHIPSLIVFNKIDLLSSEELESLENLISVYEQIGYTCLKMNALSVDQQEIEDLFKGKVTLLSGHSGVGKSTLVNILQPGLELRTAEVSVAYNKGKHTTTFAEMHPLDIGGFIVDTPGIKGFGMVATDKEDLSHYFLEMRKLLPECKFNNCQHINEPSCAVKNALEEGRIAESRYRSYLNMHNEDEGPYRTDIYG
ncbi:MAG: ribosome small subunit-dependent GTPase A [Flavobacteriales bacterium]|nr:ribosome small subunit-dependent GTPase A [Flavobacteriales bacterium]